MTTNLLALLGLLCFADFEHFGFQLVDAQAHSDDLSQRHYFPETIPAFEVRKDSYTNEPVSRGKMHLINMDGFEVPTNTEEQQKKMVKFADMHRDLQCANIESELDGHTGSYSMLRLAPPTKESIELICAWAESKCNGWVDCRQWLARYKNGQFDISMDDLGRVWLGRTAIMIRIINNEAYYDWPWGIERFKRVEGHYSNLLTDHMLMMEAVLRYVSDIGNSVFFFGGEQPFLPWYIPMPLFSFAPSMEKGDYPFPWLESYRMEAEYYGRAKSSNNFSDAFYTHDHGAWEDRIPKAAFYASWDGNRVLVFDSAVLRPDLFDVSFSGGFIRSWNPLSDEPDWRAQDPASTSQPFKPEREHPGFIQPTLKFHTGGRYTPQRFKYVIVPVGSGAMSTSGRLAGLLAHSGAVVLLQTSAFRYHFSAKLIPWVHYVPLAFSMADVIDKVQWLRDNDDKAQQIARNAANFGKSFLRLEDYFCYVASAMKLLSELEHNTTATEGFSPQLIHRN